MAIYKKTGSTLSPIKEKKIGLEKTIQNLVEANLSEIFNLKYICSEFPLNNLRIDTLAFDEETHSFVIIEYKRERNFSVIDQGYAYLALLLNNKADFVLEFNEKTNSNLRKDDIDWSQSKVIFVSTLFTKYQQEAIGFQNLPIELWEVKQYDNDLVSFNELRASEKSESIQTVTKDKNVEAVSREVKQYSVEDHFKPHWELGRQLFDELTERVLTLDSRITVHPVKAYIGYNLDGKNVFLIKGRQSKVLLELLRTRPEDIQEFTPRTRYVANSFQRFNQHVTQFDILNEQDVEYAMGLIRQVYKRFVG